MAKVLVVDDEPDIRELTRRMLEKEGHSVKCAGDGEEALVTLRNDNPDLVLLDVMMPEVDGWEVCEKIKSDWRFSHILVVMLTAKTRKEDMERSEELGADEHINKPFTRDVLLDTVEKVLKERV